MEIGSKRLFLSQAHKDTFRLVYGTFSITCDRIQWNFSKWLQGVVGGHVEICQSIDIGTRGTITHRANVVCSGIRNACAICINMKARGQLLRKAYNEPRRERSQSFVATMLASRSEAES